MKTKKFKRHALNEMTLITFKINKKNSYRFNDLFALESFTQM